MTKGRHILYSELELVFVKVRSHLPRRELHAAFQRVFDRPEVTEQHLKTLCNRNGWKAASTGQFVPGQVSHNKGKPMPYHPNSAATQFKKGSRTGRANALWKPVGTERVRVDGYLERKVHEGMPLQSRWRAVHVIRWEEIHGPLPRGMRLKCLDGDKLNTDPTNWTPVSAAVLIRINGSQRRSFDDAPPELKPTILAIARLEQTAHELKKGKSRG